MKSKQAIVLVGGLGTRLKEVVKKVPKPLADIEGKPFLKILLDNLIKKGITDFVLAVSFKYEQVVEFCNQQYKDINISYSVEEEPLGTGGAIKKALEKIKSAECFVFNGDSFFDVELKEIEDIYFQNNADVVIALKKTDQTSRYGTVVFDENKKINGFCEKSDRGDGFISGGIYLINKDWYNSLDTESRFSVEKDVFEKHFNSSKFYGVISDGYFIDIGTPDDYHKGKNELADYV